MLNDNILAELAETVNPNCEFYYYEYNGKPLLPTNKTYRKKGIALNQINNFFYEVLRMCHYYEHISDKDNYLINQYRKRYGDNEFTALRDYLKEDLNIDFANQNNPWKLRGQLKNKAKVLVQDLIAQKILTLKEIK